MTGSFIDRRNNFDFLRLFFASLVIISHSFPLAGCKEFFEIFTNNQISLGEFSVDCFFIMSGYLIFQSLERSKTLASYLWKRVLRLYPALFVLLVITLCIIPIVYQGNNIFQESSYWTYLPNGISLYRIQYEITGVFETNPYKKAINGSLWSLSYEFTLYILLMFLFPFRTNKKCTRILLTIAFIIAFFLLQFRPFFLNRFFGYIMLSSTLMYKLSVFFFAGSILSLFDLKKYNTLVTRVIIAFSLVLSVIFSCYNIVSPILLPLLVLMLAKIHTAPLHIIEKKFGDISYGVYIYGFFVQQILMNYFNLSPLILMIISLIITYILAYNSWHLIEKRSLKYKNLF